MTNYLNDEDVQYMLAVQKGDQKAFRKIVEKYQHKLMNYFTFMNALVKSESEDLVQETFLKVYLYRENYLPTAKFTTFLYRIARNTGIDYIRKKKEIPVSLEGNFFDEFLSEHPNQNINITKEKFWQGDLEEAVLRLPEKLRIVVVMSYFEDLKYQEIADILEIPLGTVKSRMNSAMNYLRDSV